MLAHKEWIGYVQPVGLVVSPVALLEAQAQINRNIIPEHTRFLELVNEVPVNGEEQAAITDLRRLATEILGWEASDLRSADELPPSMEVTLPEYEETLRPAYGVPEFTKGDEETYCLLIQTADRSVDLDEPYTGSGQWHASPTERFERLLRETRIPIGLISNEISLRLIYAPRGETSGHMTFRVRDMSEVSGRPIFAALLMLLGGERLFSLPEEQRLPSILKASRQHQNQVSTRLAEQVLAALYELVRGLQAADDLSRGALLRQVLKENPNLVYSGLLTVLLRLVFLLYAEDRNLLSRDSVFNGSYSVGGLFARLRDDDARNPDTMDHRYGAWAQLLTMFRLVFDGGAHGAFRIPSRKGYLFNPDRYPFLEGRNSPDAPVGEQLPLVSDGVVYRVLSNLMILDGERLSYRALDVEQIGSVYETIMGFSLETAAGRSVAIKPKKSHGAPVTINLEELLRIPSKNRGKWFRERTELDLPGPLLESVQTARTVEDLAAALAKRIAWHATPQVVPAGAMVLQPSEERRRSGSHYTPRSLTEPIVRKALEPVLAALGTRPRPDQILNLKVCDPAMGSGAFLVEATRQLAEELIKAWHAHAQVPNLTAADDEVVHARRLVVQRCIYGVDRNPMAVDLSKLSLWLATLAKDHAFTFVNHALRCGDSLVGLSREQIVALNWNPKADVELVRPLVQARLATASKLRERIRLADRPDEDGLGELLKEADKALSDVRLLGDAVVAAFFRAEKPKLREAERLRVTTEADAHLRGEHSKHLVEFAGSLRESDKPIPPFHWEIEYPEVFERVEPGFDVIVGNPPFGGHVTIVGAHVVGYTDWLRNLHEESSGKCDSVAHFFRRAFGLLRGHGAFGLIATKTIGQGDTRASGLRWICTHGGEIFDVIKRIKWPGLAAVVVSVVHVFRGKYTAEKRINDRPAERITAFLFHRGEHDDPARLNANAGKSFQGSIVLGMGFTFDDTDKKGVATPLAEMRRLIKKTPRNQEVVFPYIGGDEVNTDPGHAHHRYVINFGESDVNEAQRNWPDLMVIVEQKVKQVRADSARRSKSEHGRRASIWWQHYHQAKELYAAIAGLERVLVINCGATPHMAFAFLSPNCVFANTLDVFPLSSFAAFCALQSRPHEVWARFFASTMKDDLRYTPSDCFETFPFPDNWQTHPSLEAAGKSYYEFRAALMVKNNEGLTKTYNRFHDSLEKSADIQKLRDLHEAMDRAVLDAYGWSDIETRCEFELEYEVDDEDSGRKKPWRYRWPEETRDEVLARLLELNKKRAEEEKVAGAGRKPTKGRGKAKPAEERTRLLFEE